MDQVRHLVDKFPPIYRLNRSTKRTSGLGAIGGNEAAGKSGRPGFHTQGAASCLGTARKRIQKGTNPSKLLA